MSLAALLSTCLTAPAVAQTSEAVATFFKNTEVSGFVDTYYSYNFNTPSKPCAVIGEVAVFNCLRNFDVTHNSLSLSLAELALEKKPTADSRGGFRVDLDYGPTQAMVTAVEPGGSQIFQHIGQAYVSVLAPAGAGLQIDVGKFVTPAANAIEVIKPKDNWNYSRSLLFALAIPYYHVGVRATYPVNDRVSLAGFVVNGWNNAVDNNTAKTVAVQASVKPVSAITIVETYMGGPEQPNNNTDWRQLSDTVVTYKASPQLSLAADYDYGRDHQSGATVKWQGVAGYARYQPAPWFTLSPRAEYYNDRQGFTSGVAQKLKEFTLTGELTHIGGVVMRLEYRHDVSDIGFFLKNARERSTHQDTVTVGLTYAFSTKAP